MTNAVPIEVMVTRYACPHCRFRRSRKATTVAHIGRCWHNPETRSCKTCVHLLDVPQGEDCNPGRHCGCNDPVRECQAGLELAFDDTFPHTGCPSWAPTTTEETRNA